MKETNGGQWILLFAILALMQLTDIVQSIETRHRHEELILELRKGCE